MRRTKAALLLLALPAASCGAPAFDAGGAAWDQERIDEVCMAMIQNDEDTIGLSYSNRRNLTALNVHSRRFEGIEQGRFENDVTLEANGRTVPGPALGLLLGDRPGYQFRFDVRHLVAVGAGGMRLVLRRGGETIYTADLPGAPDVFGRFRDCSASLPPAPPA